MKDINYFHMDIYLISNQCSFRRHPGWSRAHTDVVDGSEMTHQCSDMWIHDHSYVFLPDIHRYLMETKHNWELSALYPFSIKNNKDTHETVLNTLAGVGVSQLISCATAGFSLTAVRTLSIDASFSWPAAVSAWQTLIVIW